MGYKFDKSDALGGLVKEGDYEAIIERMEVKTIPSGKNKLSVAFRIRDDVDQNYKNKWMFKDIWEEKDNQGVFNRKQINQLLGTQKIDDGQEFESINDVIKFLENAPLIIHVSIEFDDYRGEDVNTISYFKKTKVVPQVIQGDDEDIPQSPVPPMPDVNTDDLPPVDEPKPAQKPVNQEPAKQGVVVGDDELPF